MPVHQIYPKAPIEVRWTAPYASTGLWLLDSTGVVLSVVSLDGLEPMAIVRVDSRFLYYRGITDEGRSIGVPATREQAVTYADLSPLYADGQMPTLAWTSETLAPHWSA